MAKAVAAWVAGLMAVSVAGQARAECSVAKVMDLPVTMEGHSALVPARINGQPALFEADSGAFYSTISPGSAAQFQLRQRSGPEGLEITGVGGTSSSVSVVDVKNFDLGSGHIHDIQFIVTGNEFGHAGLLGQNIFGQFDVEYDLAHGAIRLFRSKGCQKTVIAYWAKDTSFSTLKIDPVTPVNRQTVGNLTLDGAMVKATFDTGADTSLLSLAAAARAGVHPNSPGVEEAGYTYGMGTRRVKTWIGRFKSIKIGDNEEIRNIRIRFGELGETGESTMLLGADFFLSHRVMVDNGNNRLFLTYNGGPVFDLSFERKPDDKRPDTKAIAGADPTDADGYSRRGAAYLSRRDVPRAIADLRQAVKLAPGEAAYHRQLATALLRDKKDEEASKELDAALAARPDELDSLLMRGELRVEKDRKGARADADAFDRAAPVQANDRLELAALYQRLHEPAAAVRAYSQWIAAHPKDVAMMDALNGRCWVRALAGIELDAALDDCNRAMRLSSKAASVVDSRALVWFRKGDFAKARIDYDRAIAADPEAASSIYMRGIAEARAGDKAAADRDFATAKKLDDSRADYFAGWGIKP